MISDTPLSSKANRVWSVTTAPLVDPVTLDEVKAYGRIDGTEEDDILSSFIKSVIENMEGYLGRALIEQTITMYMDWWPGNIVKLPRPPLLSITSVATLDESDVATIYSSDNYYAFTAAVPGELVLKQGVTEPVQYDRDRGGYRIIYVAGYGSTASYVPSMIKDCIKEWAIVDFDNRVVSDLPPDYWLRKLTPYKVSRYAYGK